MIDLSVRFLIKVLRLFTRAIRKKIAFFIAHKILKFSKKTRLRAISNISNAMPWLREEQVEKIAFSSYQTIVFGVMECFWLNDVDIDIECDEKTLELLNNPGGVSIATMHMSCYELVPFSVQQLTGAVTTLSKIPKFVKSAGEVYQDANINVIDKNQPNAFMKLLQASRKKQVICLHSDHYAKDVNVSFFNQKTGAPGGAAMLSAYSKVPLLLCYPILKSNGRYTVYLETIFAKSLDNSKESIAVGMQTIYDRFEKIILQYPEQWYWSYNRWRD
nr:lipid A biosynthesis acyltransferase [Pseudoalteromonas denitrificans]